MLFPTALVDFRSFSPNPLSEASCSVTRVNRPGSASSFPKAFPFHAGHRTRCDPRAIPAARRRICEFTIQVFSETRCPSPSSRRSRTRITPMRRRSRCSPSRSFSIGRDLLGFARPDRKTAAFMLPSIDRLSAFASACAAADLVSHAGAGAGPASWPARSPRARRPIAAFAPVRHHRFGGVPIGNQPRTRRVSMCSSPRRSPDRSGRQRYLTLREVEILVLDEADQMLDLGFIHALKAIVRCCRTSPDPVLSATIRRRSASWPIASSRIRRGFGRAGGDHRRTGRSVRLLRPAVGEAALLHCASRRLPRAGNMDRVLVFTRTKHGADRVVRPLPERHRRCGDPGNRASRSASAPSPRSRRARSYPCCRPTSLRAGSTSPAHHVVNFELPTSLRIRPSHRPTARAGAARRGHRFLRDDEKPYLRDIEK